MTRTRKTTIYTSSTTPLSSSSTSIVPEENTLSNDDSLEYGEGYQIRLTGGRDSSEVEC